MKNSFPTRPLKQAFWLLILCGITFSGCRKSCPTENPIPLTVDPPIAQKEGLAFTPTYTGRQCHWTLARKTESFELMANSGAKIAHLGYWWNELVDEQGANNFGPAMEEIDAAVNAGLRVSVMLKILDTNGKIMWPAHIQATEFDDPEVVTAWTNTCSAFSRLLQARIDYLWIGNEIDIYLGTHRNEIPAFIALFDTTRTRMLSHVPQPSYQIGTISTYHDATTSGNIDIISMFTKADIMGLTYYPQLKNGVYAPANIDLHFQEMVGIADGLGIPLALTETGWSSGPDIYNGTEEYQAAFLREIFPLFKTYRDQGKVDLMALWGIYDFPQDDLPDGNEEFYKWFSSLAYAENLGTAKPSWAVLLEEIEDL